MTRRRATASDTAWVISAGSSWSSAEVRSSTAAASGPCDAVRASSAPAFAAAAILSRSVSPDAAAASPATCPDSAARDACKPEKFAEHYGMTVLQAHATMVLGRQVHDGYAEWCQAMGVHQ